MVKTKMNKKKNLLKKTKKNKKYYSVGGENGGPSVAPDVGPDVDVKRENSYDNPKEGPAKEGIIDALKKKVSGMVTSVGSYATDKGLRLFGLQPIHNDNDAHSEANETKKVDETMNTLGSAASNVISDVESVGANIVNVANKGSASILENINEVLGSPQVNEGITQAVDHTKNIIENQLETVNKITSDPKFKEVATKSLDNVAEYADIAVDALNKPIDKAIDKLNEAGSDALSGVVSGSIKVGTDAMAAVPGVGAIVEAGKMLNDASKAASSVVEAGSEATTTVSDLFLETKENMKKGLKELEEKKKQSENIMNRTSESVREFENPMKTVSSQTSKMQQQVAGSNIKGIIKTKKNHMKKKGKSKRVKFDV
jgi:hypothetical protein